MVAIYKLFVSTAILLMSFASAYAFEVHRYVIQDSELRIYPVDQSLTRRQQHTALYEMMEIMKQGNMQGLVDFVKISLYEMAGLYEEEAMRSDKSTKENGFQLARWRNQSMEFATNLYRVAESVDLTTNLEVDIDSTGELQMLIDGKPYILNSPQIAKPEVLDERIINHLCSIRYCDPEQLAVQQNKFKRTIVIEAAWNVTEENTPEYVTSDGLHFMFANLEDRSRKQIAILKIIKEIKFVAETLKDAKSKGVPIEWESLSIKPFFGSYDHRISLNPFGDTVYIKLPELYRVRAWQEKLMPWIRARVEEEEYTHFLDGDDILAREKR
jgi:hypothetical protein